MADDTIPPKYLVKTGAFRVVKLLDLAILLYHVHKGSQDNEVGFLDARESLDTLTRSLNKEVYIDVSKLESALWSANIMDEQGKFWHPTLTFEQWVKSIIGNDKYHRVYGTLEKKE
jgi:hypothetical protein